jgi:hypothetical protein
VAVSEPGVRWARLTRRCSEVSRPSAALPRYFHASSAERAALLKALFERNPGTADVLAELLSAAHVVHGVIRASLVSWK